MVRGSWRPDSAFSWWAFRAAGWGCPVLGWFDLPQFRSLHLPIEAFALPLAIAGLKGAPGKTLASAFLIWLPSLPGQRPAPIAAMAPHRGDAVLGPWSSTDPIARDAPVAGLEAARQVAASPPSAVLVVAGFARAAGLMAWAARLAAGRLRRPGPPPQPWFMTLASRWAMFLLPDGGLSSPPSS